MLSVSTKARSCSMRVIGFIVLILAVLSIGVAIGDARSDSGKASEEPTRIFEVEATAVPTQSSEAHSTTNPDTSVSTFGVQFSAGQDRVEALQEANGVI